jgi:50S ribosomal subunit-associated GTPase HflX
VDGTRPETLDAAARIVEQIDREIGALPFVLVLNKHDLADRWRITAPTDAPVARAVATLTTSAKTGEGVEAAFQALANAVVPSPSS